MAEMQRITIRLAGSDLATLDRLRGHTDRSTYLRRLLRRAGRVEDPEPEADDDEGFQPFDAEHVERMRVLTT